MKMFNKKSVLMLVLAGLALGNVAEAAGKKRKWFGDGTTSRAALIGTGGLAGLAVTGGASAMWQVVGIFVGALASDQAPNVLCSDTVCSRVEKATKRLKTANNQDILIPEQEEVKVAQVASNENEAYLFAHAIVDGSIIVQENEQKEEVADQNAVVPQEDALLVLGQPTDRFEIGKKVKIWIGENGFMNSKGEMSEENWDITSLLESEAHQADVFAIMNKVQKEFDEQEETCLSCDSIVSSGQLICKSCSGSDSEVEEQEAVDAEIVNGIQDDGANEASPEYQEFEKQLLESEKERLLRQYSV